MTAVGTITPGTPAGTALYSSAPVSSRTPTQNYNSQMFLKLLTTQLANQDPSSPMDSTQMISQTSQLASMEQLTDLNTASTNSYALQERSAAANVLGKTVSWTDSTGLTKSGTATAVSFSGTTPSVTVGTDTVNLTDLTGIADPA